MKQLTLFDPHTGHQPHEERRSWKLFADGASRKNPGPAGAGIYLVNNDDEPVVRKGFYLGHKTNNQAEYLALLLGIFYAKKYVQKNDTLTIMADSELLIRQLKGEYAVKNEHLKPLHALARTLLEGMRYSCCHIMREHNAHADALANKGIDTKTSVTQEFQNLLQSHGISL